MPSFIGLPVNIANVYHEIPPRHPAIRKEKWVSYNPRNGAMIALTEIAMPGAYWHHDDFLFEKQFLTNEPPKGSPLTAGAELLKRFLRKLRIQSQFTPRPVPQTQPQPQSADVVGISYSPEIVRTFQTVRRDYLAKLNTGSGPR